MRAAGFGTCPHCDKDVPLYAPSKDKRKDPWRGKVCILAVEQARALFGVFDCDKISLDPVTPESARAYRTLDRSHRQFSQVTNQRG